MSNSISCLYHIMKLSRFNSLWNYLIRISLCLLFIHILLHEGGYAAPKNVHMVHTFQKDPTSAGSVELTIGLSDCKNLRRWKFHLINFFRAHRGIQQSGACMLHKRWDTQIESSCLSLMITVIVPICHFRESPGQVCQACMRLSRKFSSENSLLRVFWSKHVTQIFVEIDHRFCCRFWAAELPNYWISCGISPPSRGWWCVLRRGRRNGMPIS